MTVEAAMNFLNQYLVKNNYLSILSDFTEPELKEAYRNLLKIYHSDLETGDQVICKKIIQAYHTLKKKLDKNKPRKIESSKKENLMLKIKEKYIKAALENIEAIKKRKKEEVFQQKELENLEIKVNDLIVEIKNASKEEEIVKIEQSFLKELELFYRQYTNKYFNFYYIRKVEIREPLNYNGKIEDFFNQLDVIKRKYSYLKKLEETVKQYENWCGFENIKMKIENLLLKSQPCFQTSLSIENILNFIKKEIEALFNQYYSLNTSARKLNSENAIISSKIQDLMANLSLIDFKEAEKRILILKNQIENENIKNDLYVKADDIINFGKASFLYFVFKKTDSSCKVLKWNRNKENSLEIKEINQQEFLAEYVLLDCFLTKENPIFRNDNLEVTNSILSLIYKDIELEEIKDDLNQIKRTIMQEMQESLAHNNRRKS